MFFLKKKKKKSGIQKENTIMQKKVPLHNCIIAEPEVKIKISAFGFVVFRDGRIQDPYAFALFYQPV